VLILGAGMAGMTAAYELRNAGYKVQVLEYNGRAGGRNWSLRGGDRYTELGGATQQCQFDKDLYINPGPWRIPYHHHGMLNYCKKLGVPLEAFFQVNYNAYLHSSPPSAASRSVTARSRPTIRATWPSSWPRPRGKTRWTRRSARKIRKSCSNRCAWGALDKELAYGPARQQRTARLQEEARAAA
jgi:monoamine oxidase